MKKIKDRKDRKFKEQVVEKLLQKNLFLLRRLKDPSFQRFLSKEVLSDAKFLKIANQYIKNVVANKLMDSNFFFNPFSKREEWSPFNKPKYTPTIPSISDLSSRAQPFNKNVIKYLENELHLAKVDGNIEKIKAIEILMSEYINLKYGLRDLLIDPFSSEPITRNFILKYETNLKFQKIKYFELYHSHPGSILYSDYFLFIGPETEELNFQIIEMISKILDVPKEQIAVFNKFIKDIAVIIQYKWFDLKDSEEKWKILDYEYPYILNVEDFQKIFNSVELLMNQKLDSNKLLKYLKETYDLSKIETDIPAEYRIDEYKKLHAIVSKQFPIIYEIIISCMQKGYFTNSINGMEFLLSLNLTPSTKAFLHNNIGFIYLELENYEKATLYFENALKEISLEYPHMKSVIKKNLGECYFKLGRKEVSDNIFSEIEKFANGIDDNYKYHLYYNLGCSYENIGNYNKAYGLFLKITSGKSVDDDFFENTYEKIQFYENFLKGNNHLDNISINSSLENKKLRKIRTYFLLQKNHFQFKIAESTLISALDIAKKNKNIIISNQIMEELAEFYIFTKNRDKFCDLLANIDFEVKFPKIELYKGVFFLLQGNIELSLKIFSEFYTNYLDIDFISFLHYLSPKYEFKEIKPLNNQLPPILWYIQPLINFNYTISDELLNKLISTQNNLDEKGALLIDIGRVFDQSKTVQESLYFYLKAKEYIVSDINQQLVLLSNIAGVYINMDKSLESDKYIQGILKIFDNSSLKREIKPQVAEYILFNVAYYYENRFDFENAIKILDKALEFSPNPELLKRKEKYKALNKELVNYNAIDDLEIKNLLYTADVVYKKVSDISFEIDFSLVILAYCKSVEILLDKNITKKIDLSDTLELYYSDKEKRIIPKSVKRKLPNSVNAVLDSKSIGIGQWVYVFRDFFEKEKFKDKKPIYYGFLTKIGQILSNEQAAIIKDACMNLFEYRNHSAHTKFHSKEEFLEEKSTIILNLNKIFSIFSKKN